MAQIVNIGSARVVAADPRDIFEYLLNPENYLEIDHKIKRIYECVPAEDGRTYDVILLANLRGVPAPKMEISVDVERWKSIRFNQTGGRLANFLFHLSGEISVERLEEGTLLHRRYRLEARGILANFTRWWLADWLNRSAESELDFLSRRFNPGVIELRKKNG